MNAPDTSDPPPPPLSVRQFILDYFTFPIYIHIPTLACEETGSKNDILLGFQIRREYFDPAGSRPGLSYGSPSVWSSFFLILHHVLVVQRWVHTLLMSVWACTLDRQLVHIGTSGTPTRANCYIWRAKMVKLVHLARQIVQIGKSCKLVHLTLQIVQIATSGTPNRTNCYIWHAKSCKLLTDACTILIPNWLARVVLSEAQPGTPNGHLV